MDDDDSGDWTPLHVASHNNYPKIVKLLVNGGADATMKDNYGHRTPLHYAIKNNYSDIVELLVSKAAENSAKYNKSPALVELVLINNYRDTMQLFNNFVKRVDDSYSCNQTNNTVWDTDTVSLLHVITTRLAGFDSHIASVKQEMVALENEMKAMKQKMATLLDDKRSLKSDLSRFYD